MKQWFCYITLLLVLFGCKEKYVAANISSGKNLLVVEGFINVGSGAVTTIILSRVTDLPDPVNRYESNAKLEIQSKAGSVFTLTARGNGVYTSAALNLPGSESYRLHIITSDKKEYFSDYAIAKSAPDIKGISAERTTDGGIRLYTDSRITASDSRYYQWKTEETWEIHSSMESSYRFIKNNAGTIIDAVPTGPRRLPNDSIKKCWSTQNSTNILVGNLERFTTDSIHEPLVTIPPNSPKLAIMYSINIKQYALSHPAYLYLDAMRKNTEQLGSIFDAQPSDLNGNIHCISNPSEQVIGYVDVIQEKAKRFFIKAAEIPGGWVYNQGCMQMHVDSIVGLLAYPGYLPLNETIPPARSDWITVDFGTATCVDCTLSGTNIKPTFWP